MVSTPASTARRIPSSEAAWAATMRPDECAASTAARISSMEKVGRVSPPGPVR